MSLIFVCYNLKMLFIFFSVTKKFPQSCEFFGSAFIVIVSKVNELMRGYTTKIRFL